MKTHKTKLKEELKYILTRFAFFFRLQEEEQEIDIENYVNKVIDKYYQQIEIFLLDIEINLRKESVLEDYLKNIKEKLLKPLLNKNNIICEW
jgi:hypothetical protein